MRSLIVFLFVASTSYASLDSCKIWYGIKQKRANFVAKYDYYHERGFSIKQSQLQDLRMSNLVYGSLGLGLETNSIWSSDQSETRLSLDGYYFPMGRGARSFYVHSFGGQFSYAYLRKTNMKSSFSWALGGELFNQFNGRYNSILGNNAFAMDNMMGLAFAGQMNYKRSTESKRNFYAKLSYALGGYSWRYPQYVYTGVEQQWLFPGRLNKGQFELGWHKLYKHSKENRKRFAYRFEWYRLNSGAVSENVAQYQNSLVFTYWLKVH